LLGVHERICGRLTLDGGEKLEVPRELFGVVDPAAEVEKVRAGVVAAVVEINRLLLAGSPEGEGDAAREAGLVMFPGRAGVVVNAERPVLARRGDGLVADDEVLGEVLVVHAEAGGVEEAFFRGEVEKEAPAVDFAVSERVGAAESRDLAVLSRGLEHERNPVDCLSAGDVVAGEN